MPELPEVEVVCRQLQKQIKDKDQILEIEFLSPKLRTSLKLPKTLKFPLEEVRVSRRSKYLLFSFDKGFFVTHLGMTGKWRIVNNSKDLVGNLQKHDHILIKWKSHRVWIYNDTRRFGVFEFEEEIKNSKWLQKLGPEPLSDAFPFEEVIKKIKKTDRVIKDTIMDAQVIVGVGNIYACEVLFQSGVNPFAKSSRISAEKIGLMLKKVQLLLSEAIRGGGSTIQNYTHTNGEQGKFQNNHQVYAREGLPCFSCSGNIQRKMFHGRSTFWCPRCQK